MVFSFNRILNFYFFCLSKISIGIFLLFILAWRNGRGTFLNRINFLFWFNWLGLNLFILMNSWITLLWSFILMNSWITLLWSFILMNSWVTSLWPFILLYRNFYFLFFFFCFFFLFFFICILVYFFI